MVKKGIVARVYSVNKDKLREAMEALEEATSSLKSALDNMDTKDGLSQQAVSSSSAGGKARALKLSPERRKEIAQMGAMCRWAKNRVW